MTHIEKSYLQSIHEIMWIKADRNKVPIAITEFYNWSWEIELAMVFLQWTLHIPNAPF